MENLSFILWICLFPLSYTIDKYYSTKIRKLTLEKEPEESVQKLTAFIILFVLIFVAWLIYVPTT